MPVVYQIIVVVQNEIWYMQFAITYLQIGPWRDKLDVVVIS